MQTLGGKDMRLDALTSAALQHGFRRGTGFNQVAGLVYALGGRSPGHPVFTCCMGFGNDYSKIELQFGEQRRLQNAFLVLDVGTGSDRDIADILSSREIHFPDDYKLIASVAGIK
jgi:hypothetical protein